MEVQNSMDNALRMLIVDDYAHVLLQTRDEGFGEICQPHKIGDLALDFANQSFPIAEVIDRAQKQLDRCISSPNDIYSVTYAQSIVMQLAEYLDGLGNERLWPFVSEHHRLLELDRKLPVFCLSAQAFAADLQEILSDLSATYAFQQNLRLSLSKLALAGKKRGAFASNAQILLRIFDDLPELAKAAHGEAGYMIINTDLDGRLRSEMLDLGIGNTIRLISAPKGELMSRNNIRDSKMICEYRIMSNMREYMMIDLIEGLRRARVISQCATCKKYFFTADKRQTYCADRSCSTGTARMQNYKKRTQDDPVLETAFRYKNVMTSRYLRTLNNDSKTKIRAADDPSSAKDNVGQVLVHAATGEKSLRSVSYEEYGQWCEKYHAGLLRYKQVQAETLLMDEDDRKRKLRDAGEAFLNEIRPPHYKAQKKRDEEL